MRPFWYCASVCCARRHLPPVYRLRPASRPLQPFRPFLPVKRRSRWSGSQRTAAKNITASLPAAIWKTRKRLHYRKQKRKASLLAKSAIKKIKNDLQSPCRKFSGRGFICVYKKLTKEITEKLQNPIAKWFQKSYNMVTARAQALLSVKSFSSCFLGISGTGSPPPAVLLHSRDPCAAQAVSRFVCKKARPFWTSFFASINHAKTGFSCGKVWPYAILVGNLPVFLQRTFTKFGAAGVCIPAGFVVQYIQSIYRLQTWIRLMLMR